VTRVEQFELIRRDYFVEGRSIRWIARMRGVHRRTVRQAIVQAVPAARRASRREPKVLTEPMRQAVQAWLQADEQAPAKQRHTGRRIYRRLAKELAYTGAESTVRVHVGRLRRERGLGREVFVPQVHAPGVEAEVDWYEAAVDFPAGRQTVPIFVMRACASGRAFHIAYPRLTQQAFLEAHVAAFDHFGGVFERLRYDNLTAAVKQVLKGRRRVESDRFVALRSHYLFEAVFCRPGLQGAHEKGGVEGEVGRFRREHLVPVPAVSGFEALNRYLYAGCLEDDTRSIGTCPDSVGGQWRQEQAALRALPAEPFETAEVLSPRVDTKARVRVGTNHYSVPVRLSGRRVEVRLQAQQLTVWHGGQVVARHDRLQESQGEALQLDHYLEVLRYKPGAFAQSKPLAQARAQGQWPPEYEQLWQALQARLGEAQGTRQLIEVLLLHRQHDPVAVHRAVREALALGAMELSAIELLVRRSQPQAEAVVPLEALGELQRYGTPRERDLSVYDRLRPSQALEVQP